MEIRSSDVKDKKFIDFITECYAKYIDSLNQEIVSTDGFDELSEYEKRRLIFDTICKKHKFDFNDFYNKVLSDFYNYNRGVFIDEKENNPYLHSFLKRNNNEETIDRNANLYSYYSVNKDKIKCLLIDYLEENDCYSGQILNALLSKLNSGEYDLTYNVFAETARLISEQLICNGGTDCLYKSLLEKNGIYSVRVVCNNKMPLDHCVNLVYNSETKSFSFDDISSYLYGLASKDECFDYDLEDAKKLNQGLQLPKTLSSECGDDGFGFVLNSNSNGIIMPDDSKFEWYRSFGIEDENNRPSYHLPKNIMSYKKSQNTK